MVSSIDRITLFCSMDRNTDRDPQKQLDQKAMNALAQNPDNGLLVTHINQTQDLLVTTIVLSFTSDAFKSAGDVGCTPARNLFAADAHRQRESQSLQWNVAGHINHTPGQAPCLGVAGQHKRNLIILITCRILCFVFCLNGFLFACFDFRFCSFSEREHKVGGRSGRSSGMGKT